MRDEPERRNRFQCGMSLYETAEEGAMLRVNEYHHAEHRTTDVGADTRVCGGTRAIGFASPKGQAVYEFIEQVLKSQQYRRINRGQKGIERRFLAKMTGLSRAQLTRWIGRWMKTRRVQRKPACRGELSAKVHGGRHRPAGRCGRRA